jgi:hypothetical protein
MTRDDTETTQGREALFLGPDHCSPVARTDAPGVAEVGEPFAFRAAVAGHFPALPATPPPSGYVATPVRPREVRRRWAIQPGQRFGKLVAIDRAGSVVENERTRQIWRFACDCGRVIERRSDHVKPGTASHCGCSGSGWPFGVKRGRRAA